MNAYKYQKFLEGLNNLRDERDRVQKKTFTKWVNKHLMKVRKHINDLYEDLRDGHNLISLLEVLSGIKLVSFSFLLMSDLTGVVLLLMYGSILLSGRAVAITACSVTWEEEVEGLLVGFISNSDLQFTYDVILS